MDVERKAWSLYYTDTYGTAVEIMGRFELIGLNCRYTHSCPALFYVRHALELHLPGSEVRISQYTINDPYYETLLRIAASDADALLFSVYIWNGIYIDRLVRDLAQIMPDRPMVLGGPQASSLKDLPAACTVIIGEIEGVGDRFYRDMEQRTLRPTYTAESRPPFPFPYRSADFEEGLRNRQIYYESSRGCPFRCSYCLSSAGQGVRHKEPEAVRAELEQILVHEPMMIRFVDRTFNDNTERALQIWRFLASRPERTRFHFEIAPDRFTEEMFDFLATVAPGRFQFEIGIQSTNPETLAAIDRKMDVAAAGTNISRMAGLDNIHLHVDLILGLPYETAASFRGSFNRVFAMRPHYIQMGLLKILPGTPISRQTEQYGLVHCRQPPYEILASRWLDHSTLSSLHELGECVEAFRNNRYFSSIWLYLDRKGEEPFQFFDQLRAVCRRHNFFDLSPTQELMARMLCELVKERPDQAVMRELLCYDWLRCGHRFLPDFLGAKPLAELRTELRNSLPASLEGLYAARQRTEFLKRGVFLELSAQALAEVGLDGGSGPAAVCFLPMPAAGVVKHCRVVVVGSREREKRT